jgi:hypothetical protein
MRKKKAESSKKVWSDPKWHAGQRKRIKAGYAKKVWTKEELMLKVDAAKRGHVTRKNNKLKRVKK